MFNRIMSGNRGRCWELTILLLEKGGLWTFPFSDSESMAGANSGSQWGDKFRGTPRSPIRPIFIGHIPTKPPPLAAARQSVPGTSWKKVSNPFFAETVPLRIRARRLRKNLRHLHWVRF